MNLNATPCRTYRDRNEAIIVDAVLVLTRSEFNTITIDQTNRPLRDVRDQLMESIAAES